LGLSSQETEKQEECSYCFFCFMHCGLLFNCKTQTYLMHIKSILRGDKEDIKKRLKKINVLLLSFWEGE